MAPLAIFEGEIASERLLPIVASQATPSSTDYKMLGSARRAGLSSLRQAGGQRVTRRAFQALTWSMLRMIETQAERACVRRCARKRLLVMTRAARGDLLSGRGFARRCVTRVTLAVGVQAGGNRQCHTPIQWSVMTSHATALWSRRHAHVLCMIELDVEFLFEGRRETLQGRFCVANI